MDAYSSVVRRLLACALFNKRGRIVLFCIGGGAVFFYAQQWEWLRTIIISGVCKGLRLDGLDPQVVGFTIFVRGHAFAIDRDCTYAEWLLYAGPLLWRAGNTGPNLIRVSCFIALVFAINIARICLAITWSLAGVSWFWAHDIVDIWAWYGSMTICLVFWMRWMAQVSVASRVENETECNCAL